jgi:hypothetical protein
MPSAEVRRLFGSLRTPADCCDPSKIGQAAAGLAIQDSVKDFGGEKCQSKLVPDYLGVELGAGREFIH